MRIRDGSRRRSGERFRKISDRISCRRTSCKAPIPEFLHFSVLDTAWMQRTQLRCTRRACTCETLDGVEERVPGRGCTRFEVALILSRQGGDCSCGIVLRVHRFGMLLSDRRGPRQSGDGPFSSCVVTRGGTLRSSFLWNRADAFNKIKVIISREIVSNSHLLQ